MESGQSDGIKTSYAMARFHRYSFRNQLLILAQRPESARVAGYQRWQALGRQVRQGEKSIYILAQLMKKRPEPGGRACQPHELLHGGERRKQLD